VNGIGFSCDRKVAVRITTGTRGRLAKKDFFTGSASQSCNQTVLEADAVKHGADSVAIVIPPLDAAARSETADSVPR
jgi:hypothetical protein